MATTVASSRSQRNLGIGVVAAGIALALVALFVPLWGFTFQISIGGGGSGSADLYTYLDGQYTVVSSSNSTKLSCPLSGGNASQCDSLNATARFYGALESLVVGGVVAAVLGIGLVLWRAPDGPTVARRERWGFVATLLAGALVIGAAVGLAVVQPYVFSLDSPPNSNSPFGELPSWCHHGPDATFWAGCTSTGNEFIKWGPGVGWFLLLVAGVLLLLGAFFLRTRVSAVPVPAAARAARPTAARPQ